MLSKHKSTVEVWMGDDALMSYHFERGKYAIVSDIYCRNLPYFNQWLEKMRMFGEVEIICEPADEPSYQAIDFSIDKIRDFNPDFILAVGGGSTIDTAKVLWVFHELHNINWESFERYAFADAEFSSKLIAVPTTSGTGSEVTGACVLKKYDASKALIIHERIRPSTAILDFSFIATIPPNVVAYAGVDALAHVLGARTCEAASPIDQMICDQTAVTILKNLHLSFKGDRQSRKKMHVCAHLAGDMIENAGGGIEHKLDQFAKKYKLPHGLVIGILLPYTMLYLIDRKQTHYVETAYQLGLKGNAVEVQTQLVDFIWELYDQLGIARSLSELNIPEKEFIGHLDDFVEAVCEIGHVYWVQGFNKENDKQDLREMYRSAYYGI